METEIISIANYLRHKLCPLCNSSMICEVGIINYPTPVAFSDLQIRVQNKPEFWQCNSCDSYFTQNIILEDDAKKIYSDNKTNKWNYTEFQKDKTEDVLYEIRSILKKGCNVLDIGCNDGNFLNFAKNNGANTFGVEFSRIGRDTCIKNGHRVFSSMLEIGSELKFDLIFAFDLVEHLYDISSFIGECQKMLKTGGKLIILTGNPNSMSAKMACERWWYINNPEHIIFPSRKFFSNIDGFCLENYIAVYNSRGYYRISINCFWRIQNILKIFIKFFLGRYDGLPLIDKDHALIILKKMDYEKDCYT